MGMKWHRFLMVVMIIGGVVNILSGLSLATGLTYTMNGTSLAEIQKVLPTLRSVEAMYGIYAIAQGVFAIIVRCLLHGYKRSGIVSMWIMYAAGILATIIYLVAANSAVAADLGRYSYAYSRVSADLSTVTVQNIGSLISSVVLMIVNGVYYGKRSDMFA